MTGHPLRVETLNNGKQRSSINLAPTARAMVSSFHGSLPRARHAVRKRSSKSGRLPKRKDPHPRASTIVTTKPLEPMDEVLHETISGMRDKPPPHPRLLRGERYKGATGRGRVTQEGLASQVDRTHNPTWWSFQQFLPLLAIPPTISRLWCPGPPPLE